MRLKLYHAASIAEALGCVRAELGPDALILSTRPTEEGVEVTAAASPQEDEPVQANHFDPERDALLAFHGVPQALCECLQGALPAALEATLAFAPLPLSAGARPLLFTGPPGAGKTLTIARLATRLVMQGIAPAVITADSLRAGATEQLAAFTRLLGLDLVVADDLEGLRHALREHRHRVPILIDAPGTNPFDPLQQETISILSQTAEASVVLVLPAGLDTGEAAELASGFADVGATMLVATRLDLSRRLGAVLVAAHTSGLALVEAGIGPGAADGLVPMNAELLAERLMAAAPYGGQGQKQ